VLVLELDSGNAKSIKVFSIIPIKGTKKRKCKK
jgi:hypothetical protein